jgi:hypothetical protein
MPLFFEAESSTNTRRFTFEVEQIGEKGWCSLRLMRIDDSETSPGVPNPCLYDPAVHDGTSHYMGQLYRGRRSGDAVILYGMFGEPGGRIVLMG